MESPHFPNSAQSADRSQRRLILDSLWDPGACGPPGPPRRGREALSGHGLNRIEGLKRGVCCEQFVGNSHIAPLARRWNRFRGTGWKLQPGKKEDAEEGRAATPGRMDHP